MGLAVAAIAAVTTAAVAVAGVLAVSSTFTFRPEALLRQHALGVFRGWFPDDGCTGRIIHGSPHGGRSGGGRGHT